MVVVREVQPAKQLLKKQAVTYFITVNTNKCNKADDDQIWMDFANQLKPYFIENISKFVAFEEPGGYFRADDEIEFVWGPEVGTKQHRCHLGIYLEFLIEDRLRMNIPALRQFFSQGFQIPAEELHLYVKMNPSNFTIQKYVFKDSMR